MVATKNSTRNNSQAVPVMKDGDYVNALNIALIQTWEKNPRKQFDEAGLLDLVESIRQHGIQQPIVVLWLPAEISRPYRVIMGERRYRAAQIVGLKSVPVRIRVGLNDAEAMVLAVTENCQRRDLSPLEEARSFQALIDEGKTQQEVADLLGMPQSTIANRLRLLDLPEDVQRLVGSGRLSPSHAKTLGRFKAFPAVLSMIAQFAAEKGTPVKDLETALPFQEDLASARLIRVLDHSVKFSKVGCKNCPHNAFLETARWPSQVCLRPDEFDRKQADAKAQELERAAAAIATAREAGGKVQERVQKLGIATAEIASTLQAAEPDQAERIRKALPNLYDMRQGTYARIEAGHCPAECTKACPCRLMARSGNSDSLTEICIDPARHNAMKSAATKAEKKRLKVVFAQDLSEIVEEASLGANSHFAERVFGAILAEHCDKLYTDLLRKIVARMSMQTPPLPAAVAEALCDSQTPVEKLRELLGRCNMNMLVRLAAEALAVNELERALDYPHDYKPIVNFLLQRRKPEAEATPAPEVIRIVVDPPYQALSEAEKDRLYSDYSGDRENDSHCERCRIFIPAGDLGYPFTEEEKARETKLLRLTNGILVVEREEFEFAYCADCAAEEAVCRVCGCTEHVPCEDGESGETCAWAEEDLCSFCDGDVETLAQELEPMVEEMEAA